MFRYKSGQTFGYRSCKLKIIREELYQEHEFEDKLLSDNEIERLSHRDRKQISLSKYFHNTRD